MSTNHISDQQERSGSQSYRVDGIDFQEKEPVVVLGGGEDAVSVQPYLGLPGRICGHTATSPRWAVVDLNDGRRITARGHHLQWPRPTSTLFRSISVPWSRSWSTGLPLSTLLG